MGTSRFQYLSQYTSVFVSSPNNFKKIQDVHNDSDQGIWFNSDRFYEYNNGYVQLPQDQSVTTMQPGKGYVLQLGGNGHINETIVRERKFEFGGGGNSGPIPVGVTTGQFNLLGNPFGNF